MSAQCFPEYQCSEWSACDDNGFKTRNCVDQKCGRRDIIERSFCIEGCSPKIECDDWSACVYTEKADNLIQGEVSFGGYRTRVCRDVNGCVDGFIDEGLCEDVYQLKLEEVTQCETNFLLISDPASNREIAKINLDSWKQDRFDLSFVQGRAQYCPTCFNTLQDEGETGIDCGGPCKECRAEHPYVTVFAIVLLWSLSGLFTALSIRETILLRKKPSPFKENIK